jgi:hypothetical protein
MEELGQDTDILPKGKGMELLASKAQSISDAFFKVPSEQTASPRLAVDEDMV